MNAPAIVFGNLTSSALHEALAPLGVDARLARRLQAVVLRRHAVPEILPEASPTVLQRVRAAARVPCLTRLAQTVSPIDGFARYVFRGDGPEPFEAVRIPLLHRPGDRKYIVCVSAQVGCGLGCVFCATGRLGFIRNLAPWEMVAQLAQIAAESPYPVRGVVFMGMGEPLLNYAAVMTAAQILSEPCGLAIAARAITISTAGIVPAIRRFTAERRPYRLVVSLASADPDQRRVLQPGAAAYPLSELVTALSDYHAATGQRVTLAWPMLTGVNTRPADAAKLAALVAGLAVKIDLIDVNDTTGRFAPPSPEELNAFRDALRRHLGAPVVRRYSGGRDIHAACGMLAG